ITAHAVKPAIRNLLPPIRIKSEIDELATEVHRCRAAARKLVITDPARHTKVEERIPVVQILSKSRSVPSIAGFVSSIVPRPPFGEPNVAASGVPVDRCLSPLDDRMRPRSVSSVLKTNVVRFESGTDTPQSHIADHVSALTVEIHIAVPASHGRRTRMQP